MAAMRYAAKTVAKRDLIRGSIQIRILCSSQIQGQTLCSANRRFQMLSSVFRSALPLLLIFNLSLAVAQDPAPQDIETIKIDTDLVTVPVIATDAGGLYIGDLKQEDFALTEDGVQQKIAFFGKVSLPFHVVLMLDTSSSTQDKLRLIQNAAYAFVQQLQPADRVKVISFDDQVRDLNEFTNDRDLMKAAINRTVSGQGTKG